MDVDLKYVSNLLKPAGWTPNYCQDITPYQTCLQAAGFTVFPSCVKFLKQFGGVKLATNDSSVVPTYEWFEISPIKAYDMKPFRFYVKLRQLLGFDVCPVGTAANGYMVLTMDGQGKFYTIYERGVYYIGSTAPEAFQNLCQDSRNYELILTIH